MPRRLFALALSALVPLARPGASLNRAPDDPRTVVRGAAAAVRGDSAAALRSRWQLRLDRDSSDRAAALGLATLARLTYDYPMAERLYRRLASTGPGGEDRYAVYARLGLSQGLEDGGRMTEVDGLLVRALAGARALRDRAAEGEALHWLGYARSRSVGLETGVAYYDSALRVTPEGAAEVRAATRCRQAQLLILLGRGERGAGLGEAMAAAREVGDPRARAPCVRAQAISLGHRNRYDSAAALYQELAEEYRRAHDRSGRATTLAWQAVIQREELADYGAARDLLHQSEAEARASNNLYAAAVTRLFLGQLFLTLNDYRAAAAYLDQAVAAAEAMADSEVVMVSRSWRGLVSLASGDLAHARRLSLDPLEYFRRQGDLENQSEVMRTLSNIAIRERDWTAAEEALDSSEAALRRLGAPAIRVEQPFDRGRLALHRGDFETAARGFARYLESVDSSLHLHRYEVRTYLAHSYARQGDLAAAERELRTAADHLDRWRAGLSARDLRVTAFQTNASAQNDRNANMARVLAALAAGGRAEAAFELAERRRARELIDRLLQNAALARGQPSQRVGDLRRGPDRLTAAEVGARLPPGTALLEYVTGALGSPTTAFVVTRAAPGLRAVLLPPADSLTGPIARFLALVARGEPVSAEARALGEALLDPVVPALGPEVTRLVIVPDGALHRVPWDALRLRDGRYAMQRFAIGTAPSAGLVTELWRRSSDRTAAVSPGRLLAFGDPAFPPDSAPADGDADPALETFQEAFAAEGGLPRLRGSGREVGAIALYARGAELRLRGAASESWLKQSALGDFRILHFATHALVNDRVSVRTALALSPGGGEDGFVTPGDLARLRLAADLVVLSACRTAGGVVVDGEGVQGLTAPLLEAGARSVVATSWRVGDETTVRLVNRFYGGLARGAAVADALREAKLEALRDGLAPAAWAAFTVVGDPVVRVSFGRFAHLPPPP
jgi:CHAT domain-containing protein